MICKGCYKEDTEGYCLSCRKKLFDRLRIPAVLSRGDSFFLLDYNFCLNINSKPLCSFKK